MYKCDRYYWMKMENCLRVLLFGRSWTGFDDFNIALTRITPEMVADKPTFPKSGTLSARREQRSLVAHNAQFDVEFWQNALPL